jgi:hypothetical protein
MDSPLSKCSSQQLFDFVEYIERRRRRHLSQAHMHMWQHYSRLLAANRSKWQQGIDLLLCCYCYYYRAYLYMHIYLCHLLLTQNLLINNPASFLNSKVLDSSQCVLHSLTSQSKSSKLVAALTSVFLKVFAFFIYLQFDLSYFIKSLTSR